MRRKRVTGQAKPQIDDLKIRVLAGNTTNTAQKVP